MCQQCILTRFCRASCRVKNCVINNIENRFKEVASRISSISICNNVKYPLIQCYVRFWNTNSENAYELNAQMSLQFSTWRFVPCVISIMVQYFDLTISNVKIIQLQINLKKKNSKWLKIELNLLETASQWK